MKKALRLTLLIGIFCTGLLSKGSTQQYFITYSFQDQVVCDTICDTLAVIGTDMSLVEFVDWQVDGTSNYQFVDQFSIYGCFFNNFVIADVYLNNGEVIQVTAFIEASQPPIVYEVFTDAFTQCPSANNGQNPGGTNNCDVACAGSTLTYTWEYAGDLVDINVTGVPGSSEVIIDPSLFSMQITWPDPGFYAFSVFFQGQCGSTIRSLCVDVLEDPLADFSSLPAPSLGDTIYLCQGQPLQLENNSQHASSYNWNLGNGSTSTDPNPVVSYNASGIYTIELTAYNDCLCSNSISKTVVVEEAVLPLVDCIGTVCENSIATYEAAASCSEYIWQLSDNGTLIDGGGPDDNFLTVSWGEGPEGIVELQLMDCNSGSTCMEPVQLLVPILSEEGMISGKGNVCRGSITSYSITPFEGTSFEWSVSPYGSIVEDDGTNEIIVEWFDGNIPGNPDHWVAVEYDNCYLGCGGRDTLEVFINPEIYTTGPLEVCRLDSTQHQALSLPGNNPVNCDWQVLDNSGVLIWQSPVPTDSPLIPWNTVGSYQVIAIPEDTAAYCVPSYRAVMNVLPLPQIQGSIDGDTLICPGQPYTYEASTNDPRASILWEINDGGTISTMEGNTINYTFGPTPPYELYAYALDPFGCTSAAVTQMLAGIPPVTVQGDTDGCVEANAIFTVEAYPELEYSWEVIPAGRGTIIGPRDGSNIEVLWHSAGPTEVAVSICGQADTLALVIHPLPMPAVLYPDAICAGEQATVQAGAGFSDYTWYDDNSTIVGNTPNNLLFPGNYELEVTDNFGCTGTTLIQIDEYPEPAVNITTPDPNLFCNVPISTRLFANTTGAGYNYQWYADGNPVGSNSPQYTATAAGIYYVEITDANGCLAVSNTIAVAEDCINGPPLPGPSCPATPGFEPIVATADCDTREYQNLSAGSVAWIWNFDDPASGINNTSSMENPTHIYTAVGFYRVLLLAGYPFMGNPDSLVYCPTIQVDTVLVKADFTADTVCAGTTTTFEDLSSFLPVTSIVGWQWDFGDPASGASNTSTLDNPTHVYTNPGLYDVSLTVTAPSGCTSTRTRTVEVKSLPDVDFTLPPDNCEDIALPFFALVSDDVTTLSWDFGDPASGEANQATEANTYHDYTLPGDYDITLEAQSIYGCENSLSQQLIIAPNTLAGAVAIQPGNVICEGDTAVLSAPAGGSSWQWSTGENSESILVTQTGTYALTLTDDRGCTHSPDPVAVTVQPPPQAIIRLVEFNDLQQPIAYYYDGYEACEGTDVTLEVIEQPDFSYEWSTGATGTSIEFLEGRDEQLSAGAYTFDLTITNNLTGCTSASTPFEVIIHPLPQEPQVSASPGGLNCEGSPVIFQVDNVEPGVAYTWSNGLEGPSMQTDEAGIYFVTAQTPNGCRAESNRLNITSGPNINLIPNGCYTRCRPDTLCLPEVPGVVAYQWLLNGNPVGPSESTPPELIAMVSGSYQLEMQNNFGCTLTSDPLELELLDGLGTLLGEVWIDVNENGLIDDADSLYAGATIELLQNNTLQDTSISNPQGNYAFPNIEASNYTLLLDTLSLPDYLVPLYTQVDTALIGCGSEVPVDWLLQNLCEPDTTTALLSGCDTILYNGIAYSRDTAFTEIFSSLIGCDSVVQVSIDVLGTSDINLVNLAACAGDTLVYEGLFVPAGDTININYTNLAGCDSVVTVIAEALPTSDSLIVLQACEGTSLTYNGAELSAGEEQEFVFANAQGCDSTVVVMVEALLPSDSTLMFQACEGTSLTYNGTELSAGEEQEFVFANAQGCDSTVVVMVEALLPSDSTLMFQACEGTSLTYNGTELSAGEEQEFVFTNAQGCDSMVTVIVEALLASDSTLFFEACEGSNITYEGTAIPAGSQAVFTFTNTVGCDSVVAVEVAALLPTDSTLQLSACEGSTVTVNGQEIPAGTEQSFTLLNAAGCDSLLTVEVEAVEVFETMLQLSGCEGDSTLYNGQPIAAGEVQEFVFTTATGCDSIVTVQVEALGSDTTDLTLSACPGETVSYNGDQLAAGAEEQYVFLNTAGCDSIVNVRIVEVPAIAIELSTTNSCPNEDTGIMDIDLLPGSASPLQFSLDGAAFETTLTYPGLSAGIYELTARDANGCDATYEFTIEQEPPLLINIESRPITCDQPIGQLQAIVLSGEDGSLTLEWSNDTVGTTLTATEAGVYELLASNACVTRRYEARLEDQRPDETSILYVPNAFSPNGDGINDTFRGYTPSDAIWRNYHLMVFDRWGDMLFESNDPEEGWDGDMRSQAMNNAVQVWHVEGVVESCGRIFEVKQKGDITIVR